MTKFEDITINPNTAEIDCYRYKNDESVDMAFTIVEQGKDQWYIRNAAESQLYQLLGLTLEGIANIPWEQRAPVIMNAFTKPLVLKCADGYVYAVVSTEYTTVRHKQTWGWAQDMLGQRLLSAELMGTLSTERKLFARFHTYKVFNSTRYNTYNNGFFILNSVRNTGGLSFGQSIFIPEQGVYLTGPSLHTISHCGDISKIEDEFKSLFLSSFFNFSMPNWNFLKNQPQQCLIEKLDDVVRKYRIAIVRRLNPDANLYDAIVMTADVAQAAPAKTRLELENLAYKVAFNEK